MSPFFYAQISSLTHNFRGKPGTTLAMIPVQYSMQSYHKERKRKSSSGKSPFGSAALNGRSPSASALSLINFVTKERRPHKLHYFVVHCSNKFSTCSICGFRKVRKIIGWDTKDRGDINK